MIYLAGPYSHTDAAVMEDRFRALTATAASLMEQGESVYSPITHGHAVQKYLPEKLRTDHKFWLTHCMPLLARSDRLTIVTLDGYDESRGVQWEIATARALGIPVAYIPPAADARNRSLDPVRRAYKQKMAEMKRLEDMEPDCCAARDESGKKPRRHLGAAGFTKGGAPVWPPGAPVFDLHVGDDGPDTGEEGGA